MKIEEKTIQSTFKRMDSTLTIPLEVLWLGFDRHIKGHKIHIVS